MHEKAKMCLKAIISENTPRSKITNQLLEKTCLKVILISFTSLTKCLISSVNFPSYSTVLFFFLPILILLSDNFTFTCPFIGLFCHVPSFQSKIRTWFSTDRRSSIATSHKSDNNTNNYNDDENGSGRRKKRWSRKATGWATKYIVNIIIITSFARRGGENYFKFVTKVSNFHFFGICLSVHVWRISRHMCQNNTLLLTSHFQSNTKFPPLNVPRW